MDSTTVGFLLPTDDAPPLADADLEDVLRLMIGALTDLPAERIQPRWPATVAAAPEPDTNWCVFSIEAVETDGNVLIRQRPAIDATLHADVAATSQQDARPVSVSATDDQQELIQHELLDLVVTCYGPHAQRYATQLRDGMVVPQTNETLRPYRLAVVRSGPLQGSAALTDGTWLRRFDLSIDMRHEVVRTYAIRNLSSAPVALNKD
ncbi:phage neck terminator protein [Chitinasiproducens palmae]|uniref:Phage neck terminator protein gp12-like domain-containing protein n=1 Tax=Chitinasiproducens palmae TaxID=1770053 RepID=A0A1H2PSG8_9BURK|nr:hypothetical protein [Chitinasiproducens palmae]SDV49083.1 hypothetical protein SAMN05216551_10752 [Chitinasiproducens palmae]